MFSKTRSSEVAWVEIDAVIDSSEASSTLSKPPSLHTGSPGIPRYVTTFYYTVGKVEYSGKYETVGPAEIGSCIRISYNPANPAEHTGGDRSVEHRWTWWIWIVLGAVLYIAFTHLFHK